MINIEPEKNSDDQTSFEENAGERLTTADMAATASAPTKAKAPIVEDRANPQEMVPSSEEGFEPLFDDGESEGFQSRWYAIQAGFVDQPSQSVKEADELVATVMKRLAEVFAAERENLELDWARGEDVSTEDLRLALRRYRSFFDRLLSV